MNGFGTQTGNYNMNGYSTSGQYTNGLYMNGQTGQYNMYQSTTLQYTNGQYSNGQYVQSTGMYTTNNQYMNGQNTQPQYGMYTTCSNQPTTPNVFSNTANLLSNKTHQTQPMQGTTTYTSSSSSSFQFPFWVVNLFIWYNRSVSYPVQRVIIKIRLGVPDSRGHMPVHARNIHPNRVETVWPLQNWLGILYWGRSGGTKVSMVGIIQCLTCMEANTLAMLYADDHLFCRISKQILPSL